MTTLASWQIISATFLAGLWTGILLTLGLMTWWKREQRQHQQLMAQLVQGHFSEPNRLKRVKPPNRVPEDCYGNCEN